MPKEFSYKYFESFSNTYHIITTITIFSALNGVKKVNYYNNNNISLSQQNSSIDIKVPLISQFHNFWTGIPVLSIKLN